RNRLALCLPAEEYDGMTDSTRSDATSSPPGMPFSIWIFLRLAVPTGPIVIQYLLWTVGLYAPPFPQPTYLVLLFSLPLVTATEYQDVKGILWGYIAPAVGASVLYTAYVLTINEPTKHARALLFGFVMWLILVFINVIRVARDVAKRAAGGSTA